MSDALEDTIELLDSAGIPPGPLAWRVREYRMEVERLSPPNRLAGGSAFPLSTPMANDRPGMSLRDYFAAAALIAMQANRINDFPEAAAKWSYAIADAMLAERKKSPTTKQEKNNVTGS